MTDKNPPQHLLDQCNQINERLIKNNCHVEPYLAYCSEGPDEWRFRVLDTEGNELVRHLFPQYTSGHTLMLMLEFAYKQFNEGVNMGIKHAAETIQQRVLGIAHENKIALSPKLSSFHRQR